jgi:hypothetical protein
VCRGDSCTLYPGAFTTPFGSRSRFTCQKDVGRGITVGRGRTELDWTVQAWYHSHCTRYLVLALCNHDVFVPENRKGTTNKSHRRRSTNQGQARCVERKLRQQSINLNMQHQSILRIPFRSPQANNKRLNNNPALRNPVVLESQYLSSMQIAAHQRTDLQVVSKRVRVTGIADMLIS